MRTQTETIFRLFSAECNTIPLWCIRIQDREEGHAEEAGREVQHRAKAKDAAGIQRDATYRARHPLCEECERNGRVALAQVVDHIIEIADGGDPVDPSNLQSLCHACHNRKHRVKAPADGGI